MNATDWISLLGSLTTVTGLVAFVAIAAWAWSRRRHAAFEAAAQAPFALPDEIGERPEGARR